MLRRYVALFLLYSLLILAVSGAVLYIMPHGRIAYWIDWRFLGLNKEQWDNIHILFGFMLVIFGAIHIFLNKKAIVKYIKGGVGLILSREFLITSAIVFVTFAGTALNWFPFRVVGEFEEYLKERWNKPENKPPIPHMELFPLSKVAKILGLSPERALEILCSKGLKVKSPSQTLKEIARENGLSPKEVYEILKKAAKGES